YVPLPFRPAADIVHFYWQEVVDNVRGRTTGVANIVDNALVAVVHYVRLLVQRMVANFQNETSVRGVVLARPVTVDGPNADSLRTELLRGVQTHELAYPFRNCVVIELFDCDSLHNVFGEAFAVIAIYLGA